MAYEKENKKKLREMFCTISIKNQCLSLTNIATQNFHLATVFSANLL